MSSGNGGAKGVINTTSRIDAAYAFDPTDDKKLVFGADNVFVGRVVQRVGSSEIAPISGPAGPGSGIPQTQVSVEVQENVYGKLAGTVTVNQTGGYQEYVATEGPKKGERVRELVIVDGDPLLEPGETALFVTSYDEAKGWHSIGAQPFGDVRVKNDKQRGELKAKFKEAKAEQVDPYAARRQKNRGLVDVLLVPIGDDRARVAEEVRLATGTTPEQAAGIVENIGGGQPYNEFPYNVIAEGAPVPEAEAIKADLEKAGATVELRPLVK